MKFDIPFFSLSIFWVYALIVGSGSSLVREKWRVKVFRFISFFHPLYRTLPSVVIVPI